jgi:hypothetical protein
VLWQMKGISTLLLRIGISVEVVIVMDNLLSVTQRYYDV